MNLRPATIDDIDLLTYWDSKPHVVAASGSDDSWDWQNELPRDVPWCEFWIGEHEGRPIGFIAIIDPYEEETHYWGEVEPHLRAMDIWIGEESDLGRGYGTAMMQLAIDRCFADPEVEAILIDPLTSNVDAQRFYRRMGFAPVGQRWFDDDDCLVMRLDRPTVA